LFGKSLDCWLRIGLLLSILRGIVVTIRLSFDPDSSVNEESDSHAKKQCRPRIPTEAGKQMDNSEEQPEKILAPIQVRFDQDSNVHDESDLQLEKHFW
jgi:hypothetical protein